MASTAMGRFAAANGFERYEDLHAWSIEDLPGFWNAVTTACGIRWHTEPTVTLEHPEMPGTRWFAGGTLNYADHALAACRDPDLVDHPAIIARSQTRPPSELTWRDLVQQVAATAAWLRDVGVGEGDRVGAYLPNIPETIVAFLATASIGAIWSSCAPEFGIRSVVDRFAQIEPAILFVVDGYRYGSKDVDRGEHVEAIIAALPSLRHVVVVSYLDGVGADALVTGGASAGPARHRWDEVATEAPTLGIVAVAADHPLYVLFSSGTTGLPKAIVHGHGGVVAEHLKVLTLHQDLRRDDRFFWFTTTGWMMWNYLVSGLLVGSTIVVFDGDPGAPDLNTLWNLAAETECTIFGVSAPFLMSCRKAGIEPVASTIRCVGSTGAPLPADGFRWVDDELGVPVSSIAGGTDVATAFVGSSPMVPVRAGEISCRLLGCAVEAFDPAGERCPPGETGELVVTKPMPSMPVGFWGDADGSKLRAAYFDDFPGVWRHGDWVTFDDDGSCIITGRSDATLNRGGVRLGTSDFYAVVEGFDEVADSLVVHLDDEGHDTGGAGLGTLLLYVQLAADGALDDELASRIRTALRTELSPRHVPDRIEATPSVPRTLSGKKLEVPVKRILQGARADDVAARGALADPGALDWYAAKAASTPG
ncbi:MAG: acetoacetate--CoA ligase [Acidimicrobiia bacterium]|nr:acetoacetate--CoA ligase [Acidimicrobiia bacterium]